MRQSRSVRDDRPNLELAHRRMVASATANASIAVMLLVGAIAVYLGAYSYLEALDPRELRLIASLLLAGIILWHAKNFARSSLRYFKTAHEIELKLHVDKTLEKHGIRDPLSEQFKKHSKKS